jgi:EmrB/QacA subfamily drug resistance transporter
MPDRFDAQPARNAGPAPIRPDLRGPPGSLPGSGLHGRSRPRWTLLVGSMAAFMVGLDAVVVNTALPTMRAAFGASLSTLGWTISAYSLAFAALILTGSALGDRYGRRRIFVAGLSLFTLASAACAASPTAGLLIAARAVQGAGGGLAVPLSLVMITEAFPAHRRGAVVGIWGAITGIAVGLGPLVGGAIVQGLSWQWVFWVNVPIGLLVITVGARLLTESRGPARQLDLAGLALASTAIFCLTDALIRGPGLGWTSAEVLALLAGGAAGAAAFWRYEHRAAHPMLPPDLFANTRFSAAAAARFTVFAGIFAVAFLIPQYLQLERGYHPLAVGLAVLPFTAPMIAIAPLAGKLADRYGERVPIFAGLASMATALALIATTITATSGYTALAGPLLLAGIGAALAFPATVSGSLRAVPPHQLGIASGVSATLQQLGGVFAIAAVTAIFTSTGGYQTPATFVHGLRPALLAIAAVALAGALAGLAARGRTTIVQKVPGPAPAIQPEPAPAP